MNLRSLRAAGWICGRCYNRHVLLDLSSLPAEIPSLAWYLCEPLGKVAIAAGEPRAALSVRKQLAHTLTWKGATHRDLDFLLPALKTQI